LLRMSRASAEGGGEGRLAATWRRLRGAVGGARKDAERDVMRMHEGWMLPVLSRFGGYAESSEDGRLVYLFPALLVTAGEGAHSPLSSAAPPPVSPPLYERPWKSWDGGEKTPLVVLLGLANLGLLAVFRSIGGMSFALPSDVADADAAAARAKALGRRAGGGFGAESHGGREPNPVLMAVRAPPRDGFDQSSDLALRCCSRCRGSARG